MELMFKLSHLVLSLLVDLVSHTLIHSHSFREKTNYLEYTIFSCLGNLVLYASRAIVLSSLSLFICQLISMGDRRCGIRSGKATGFAGLAVYD